jgi:hypothetical protein
MVILSDAENLPFSKRVKILHRLQDEKIEIIKKTSKESLSGNYLKFPPFLKGVRGVR